MRTRNLLLFISCTIIVLATGGISWGQCVPDNNDYSLLADDVSLQETIHDWVCPDDPVDYYRLEIAYGDGTSGSITMSSEQVGTEFKITGYHYGSELLFATTEAEKEKTINISEGQLKSDIYYLRVKYYSAYAEDHEYTVTLDLEEKEKGPHLLAKLPEGLRLLLKPDSPWPMDRGLARNTGRSVFKGPGSHPFLKKSKIIIPTVEVEFDVRRYHGLRVGPGNKIYYTDTNTNAVHRFYLGEGQRMVPIGEIENMGSTPPCFDYDGNFYIIGISYFVRMLTCYNTSLSTKKWSSGLPAGDEWWLLAAGNKIYTKTKTAGKYGIQTWDKSGNQLKDIAFPDEPLGFAEDSTRNKFYVQTEDKVYKYNNKGTLEWVQTTFDKGELLWGQEMEPKIFVQPIVSPNGQVYIRDTFLNTSWVVFNADGSIFKEEISGLSFLPGGGFGTTWFGTVALASDGKFYKVNNSESIAGPSARVTCYTNWDEEVWSIQIGGAEVDDMIIDAENRIYVCYRHTDDEINYTYRWQCLDPADGNTIHEQTVPDIPGSVAAIDFGAELAIAEGESLVLLHKAGYISLYTELILATPGQLKEGIKLKGSGSGKKAPPPEKLK